MRVTVNNVLVKKRPAAEEEHEISSGGIITSVKNKPESRVIVKADVVGVGPDVRTVKEGDVINLYKTHFTLDFAVDGVDYALAEELKVLWID